MGVTPMVAPMGRAPKAVQSTTVDFFSETARVSRVSFLDYFKRVTHA